MEDLRRGLFDVLIGVNLLREGLDLPEVSLVAILDADKEGFLRSHRSLTQTAGRAARHLNGQVIMYADKITNSMQKTIDETERKRIKQLKYNEINNITPTQIKKELGKIQLTETQKQNDRKYAYQEKEPSIAADPVIKYMTKEAMEKAIKRTENLMFKSAEKYDYTEAARYRDELEQLKNIYNQRNF
jgi:excinuclease ABC subunit B